MSIYIKDKNGEIKKVGMVTNVEMTLDDMWDYIQSFGQRTSYAYFSDILWTAKNFKPKYDVRPTTSYQFLKNTHGNIGINKLLTEGQVNMKKLEEEKGIVFDFSNCTNLELGFANGLFSELNVIDVSKATLNYAFYGGYLNGYPELKLRRIERLICSENTTFYANTFSYDGELVYVGFEGVLATSGLNLSYSEKLNKESHIKLINILSSTTTGLSITLSSVAVNKTFETSSGANDGSTSQEWLDLIATKSNWTISLS